MFERLTFNSKLDKNEKKNKLTLVNDENGVNLKKGEF